MNSEFFQQNAGENGAKVFIKGLVRQNPQPTSPTEQLTFSQREASLAE